jgi:hypothetical protein
MKKVYVQSWKRLQQKFMLNQKDINDMRNGVIKEYDPKDFGIDFGMFKKLLKRFKSSVEVYVDRSNSRRGVAIPETFEDHQLILSIIDILS